jgi:hypothetical protein
MHRNPMRLRSSILLLPLWFAAPAWGEERSDRLLDLLSHVPTGLIESDPGAWSNLWFTDIAAASDELEPLPAGISVDQLAPWGAWARVYLPGLSEIVAFEQEGAWEPILGFGPLDIEAAVVVGTSPEVATLLRLDPVVAQGVAPAMLAYGYVEETRDGVAALVRGEGDYRTSMAEQARADPLGGSPGFSSRVVLDSTLLVHARGWPPLLRLLREEEPKGHPDLPALAAALNLPDWGDTALLQAFFLPHQLELGTPGSGGPPPWRLGMVADLGAGTETVTLAMFTYTTRQEAEAAAQRLAETWDDPIPFTFNDVVDAQLAEPGDPAPPDKPSLQDLTGAGAQTGVAGEGPFVAWLAIRSATEASSRRLTNRPFEVLWRALNIRDLVYFGAP